MNNCLKNIFKISFTFVATILGAGFASGKELVIFFAKFNKLGLLGFLISSILFFLSCFSILFIIYELKPKSYNNFINSLFGNKLGNIVNIFNLIFLFSIFSIMIAAGGATISSLFNNLNTNLANLIFCFIILFILNFGTKGVIRLNVIISPILILSIIFFGIYLSSFCVQETFTNQAKIVESSISYTSYNIVTTISLLFSIKNLILNQKISFFSALLSSIIIFIIGLFIIIPLIRNYDIIFKLDLPLVHLISQNSLFLKFIYTIVLFLAILTTAVGNGFSFIQVIENKLKYESFYIKLFICFLALLFSFLGFSNLIERIYPIFGYISIFELVVILITFFYLVYLKLKNVN